MANYFRQHKHLGQFTDLDRLQFYSQIREKNGLRRLEAVSTGKDFPGTMVDMVSLLVTEQPLLKERVKRDLSFGLEAVLQIED